MFKDMTKNRALLKLWCYVSTMEEIVINIIAIYRAIVAFCRLSYCFISSIR